MLKRLLFAALLFSSFSAHASHLLGGEITYKCQGNGIFQFTVIVYRDCSGISFNQASVNLSGPVPVSCALVNTYDITPRGPSETGNIRCNPPTTYNAGKGGSSKFVYEGIVNLSSLGPTPTSGYTWSTSNIPCCRNSSNNSNCTGDMVLRVVMRPFRNEQNVVLAPADLCDDSPVFSSTPNSVFVLNANDTVVLNNSGIDNNTEDVVRFAFTQPWTNNGAPCDYNQGYSINNPLPGLIGVAIDSNNGITRLRPLNAGSFQTAVRLESRRCGQLISEVYRDFQLNVINNPASARPPFNPNASASDQLYQQKAPFFANVSNWASGALSQQITLYAGDTLIYPMQAYDNYPLFDPPVPPAMPVYNPDEVTLFVSSNQLGLNGNDPTTGCLTPPCAVIQRNGAATASPVRFSAAANIIGYGYANEQQVEANIFWTPGCAAQLDTLEGACALPAKTYQFAIYAMDDASPLRGISSRELQVRVIGAPEVAAPVFRQLSLDPLGQVAHLSWSQSIDTSSIDPIDLANYPNASQAELRNRSVQRRLNAYGGIEIQRAAPFGSFTTIALINDLAILDWADSTIVPGQMYYYRLASVNACTEKRNYSEELKTLQFVLGHDWATGTAQLSWDSLSPIRFAPATFTGQVLVERENFTVQPELWQLQATISGLTQFNEVPQTFGDSLNYRVGFVDSSGLISYSRAFGSVFDLNALSVSELDKTGFQLYPNPAYDQLYLRLVDKIKGSVMVQVHDIQGKLVQHQQINVDETPQLLLDISALAPGMYQLSLRRDNQLVGIQRFVKR